VPSRLNPLKSCGKLAAFRGRGISLQRFPSEHWLAEDFEREKLLYDIYHMQIMGGDVIGTLRAAHPLIGFYHTAERYRSNQMAKTPAHSISGVTITPTFA